MAYGCVERTACGEPFRFKMSHGLCVFMPVGSHYAICYVHHKIFIATSVTKCGCLIEGSTNEDVGVDGRVMLGWILKGPIHSKVKLYSLTV